MPPARVGFVGLGNMGMPMAGRLAAAGFKLSVADLNREAVDRFCRESGGSAADDPRALGKEADVVITMLPEGKAVREVLLGENGVVGGLRKGAILIDMSSCAPVGTRTLAGELAELGFPLIDAPVSGGVAKAVDGSLSIMAGCDDPASIEACREIFGQMGKLFVTGGSGSGHAMKAMNNFLSAATLAITSEAVLTGARFGLDPKVMVDIINASTGRSNSSEHKFPTFILPRTFNSGFFLGLMAKDLRFARELAETMQTPHELIDAISALWDRAEEDFGFKADNTDVHRYLEGLADV